MTGDALLDADGVAAEPFEKAGREGHLARVGAGDPVPVLPDAWLRIETDGDALIGSYVSGARGVRTPGATGGSTPSRV